MEKYRLSFNGLRVWFNGLPSFIIFDIENFYLSISPELFDNSIDFAKSMYNISENDLKIIMNARKAFLFLHEEPWKKKMGKKILTSQWDVLMVLKFAILSVHLFLIKQVPLCKNRTMLWLYRDDSLATFRNFLRPNIERKKKRIIKIFKISGYLLL